MSVSDVISIASFLLGALLSFWFSWYFFRKQQEDNINGLRKDIEATRKFIIDVNMGISSINSSLKLDEKLKDRDATNANLISIQTKIDQLSEKIINDIKYEQLSLHNNLKENLDKQIEQSRTTLHNTILPLLPNDLKGNDRKDSVNLIVDVVSRTIHSITGMQHTSFQEKSDQVFDKVEQDVKKSFDEISGEIEVKFLLR